MPGNDIRLASFEIPTNSGAADASIVVLGGDAGGLEANVNRWRQQAGLKPANALEIQKQAEAGKGKIGEYQLFQLQGEGGKASILAAVFTLPGRTVFVKLTGQPESLKSQKSKFTALCQSIRAGVEN